MDVGAGVGGMRTPSVSNIKKRLVGIGLKVRCLCHVCVMYVCVCVCVCLCANETHRVFDLKGSRTVSKVPGLPFFSTAKRKITHYIGTREVSDGDAHEHE